MKIIAFVHDRIVYPGGAENILKNLITKHANSNSQSKIFTLFTPHTHFHGLEVISSLPKWINTFFHWTQKKQIPVLSSLFDYRNLMPFYPFLCRLLQRKIQHFSPEQCIISSFAAVKNVVPIGGRSIPTHLYLHSPNQYIRENYAEYTNKLTGYKRLIFIVCSKYLRIRDKKTRTYSTVESNSKYTKGLAVSHYGINPEKITVSYPALPQEIYTYTPQKHPSDYYIFVGRLVTFVRELDRIIDLANTLKLSLLIMGDGPDRELLQESAGPTITFLGSRTGHEKYEILRNARGLINITKESCGIVTLEALALGVPVFGYNAGGTQELIDHGKTGRLVDSKDHKTLIDSFKKFQSIDFERSSVTIGK